MSTVDRICNDATTAQLCTRQTHEEVKRTPDMFAAATVFRGHWADGTVCADCRRCGSSLSVDPKSWTDEWDSDEPTEPFNPCRRVTP